MDHLADLRERVSKIRKELGLTRAEAAERIGIHDITLKSFMFGGNLETSTIKKVERFVFEFNDRMERLSK